MERQIRLTVFFQATELCILLLISQILFSSQNTISIPMPDLIHPDEIQVLAEKIYIGEYPYVHIHDRRDGHRILSIGGKGDGPKEFSQYCLPLAVMNQLIVSSQGKVSFFTLDGVFIREKRINLFGASFKPVADYFGVYAYASNDKINYRTIDLYDKNFKKIKELYRYRLWHQLNGDNPAAYIVDSSRFRFQVMDHFLVWNDMKDFIIYIWNADNDTISTVRETIHPIPVTSKDKDEYRNIYNKPRTQDLYRQIKGCMRFPDHFPGIRGFALSEDRIYVYTYQQRNGLSEFLIYTYSGKKLKQVFLPLEGGIKPEQYPFCFSQDKLYQLVDGEEWTLRITAF